MESKKGTNLFFGFIAVILGWTLFKHFDFKNFKFEDLALDILYLIVFVISICVLIKGYRRRSEK